MPGFNFPLTCSLLLAAAVLVASSVTSPTRAGVQLTKQQGTFYHVVGSFAVPYISGGVGSAADVWVGIDNETCGNFLRAGVTLEITEKGPSYVAWSQWFPDQAVKFENITIASGDIVTLTVTLPGGPTTIAQVQFSDPYSGTQDFHFVTSGHTPCRKSVEWIVEDDAMNKTLISHFSSVIFPQAVATGQDVTQVYGPSEGVNVEMVDQDSKIVAVPLAVTVESFQIDFW